MAALAAIIGFGTSVLPSFLSGKGIIGTVVKIPDTAEISLFATLSAIELGWR